MKPQAVRKQEDDGVLDLRSDTALFFVETVRYLATQPNATNGNLATWQTLEKWLGCGDRELSLDHQRKIVRTWCSYLATSSSPSPKTEQTFGHYSALAKRDKWTLIEVPPAIAKAFDQMFLDDKELGVKIELDRVQRIAQAMGHSDPNYQLHQRPR